MEACKFLQEIIHRGGYVPAFAAPAVTLGDADDVDQGAAPDEVAIEDAGGTDGHYCIAGAHEWRRVLVGDQTPERDLAGEFGRRIVDELAADGGTGAVRSDQDIRCCGAFVGEAGFHARSILRYAGQSFAGQHSLWIDPQNSP